MFWYGHGMGLFGAIAMIIVTLALTAGVVAAVAVLVRGPRRDDGGVTPDRILADRYARGEITDDEYHHRLSTLHRP